MHDLTSRLLYMVAQTAQQIPASWSILNHFDSEKSIKILCSACHWKLVCLRPVHTITGIPLWKTKLADTLARGNQIRPPAYDYLMVCGWIKIWLHPVTAIRSHYHEFNLKNQLPHGFKQSEKRAEVKTPRAVKLFATCNQQISPQTHITRLRVAFCLDQDWHSKTTILCSRKNIYSLLARGCQAYRSASWQKARSNWSNAHDMRVARSPSDEQSVPAWVSQFQELAATWKACVSFTHAGAYIQDIQSQTVNDVKRFNGDFPLRKCISSFCTKKNPVSGPPALSCLTWCHLHKSFCRTSP